jgi:RNA polymerase sigma-70 factor, ECF subfamily
VDGQSGAATLGQLASAIGHGQEESSIIAELKAGSEDAYSWLIAQYHQPIYGLVYRILDDPSDAPDTTQEVFFKVVKGIKRFNGQSSLKTWLYRIALHEASNRRRWWFRHKRREKSIEFSAEHEVEGSTASVEMLADTGESPLELVLHEELRAKIEQVLKEVPEPYRTTVILRDIEDLSYEQIAEVMEISLGTVKSRLVRGRQALRKRLERCARELGVQIHPDESTQGLEDAQAADQARRRAVGCAITGKVGEMQVEGSS